LKTILLNQERIMTNQKMFLEEVQKRYDPDRSDANAALCMRVQISIGQTTTRITDTEAILKPDS
jgi:hypothetical protein